MGIYIYIYTYVHIYIYIYHIINHLSHIKFSWSLHYTFATFHAPRVAPGSPGADAAGPSQLGRLGGAVFAVAGHGDPATDGSAAGGIGGCGAAGYLVGGDWNMFMFPYNYWELHHPNWIQLTTWLIFFSGVGTTKQSCYRTISGITLNNVGMAMS